MRWCCWVMRARCWRSLLARLGARLRCLRIWGCWVMRWMGVGRFLGWWLLIVTLMGLEWGLMGGRGLLGSALDMVGWCWRMGAFQRVLSLVQAWLSDERFAASRLVLLTRDAVAVRGGERLLGLSQSPVWGLVRSAQSEDPGRFVLVDMDAVEASWGVLGGRWLLVSLSWRSGRARCSFRGSSGWAPVVSWCLLLVSASGVCMRVAGGRLRIFRLCFSLRRGGR